MPFPMSLLLSERMHQHGVNIGTQRQIDLALSDAYFTPQQDSGAEERDPVTVWQLATYGQRLRAMEAFMHGNQSLEAADWRCSSLASFALSPSEVLYEGLTSEQDGYQPPVVVIEHNSDQPPQTKAEHLAQLVSNYIEYPRPDATDQLRLAS